jgi:hypothetical protein
MSTEKWRQENTEKLRGYRRKWYDNNKEHAKGKVVERRDELKRWLLQLKSTFSCSVCGEGDIDCLDFHHLDKTAKDINVAQVIEYGWSKERILQEMDKCICLCSNCHRKLHAKERREHTSKV